SELKEKARQIETLNDRVQVFEAQNLFGHKIPIKDGLNLTLAKVQNSDPNNLRKLGDIFVDKDPKGVLFLMTTIDDKVSFILKTNRNNKAINCSEILKKIMPIVNGRGGGKPDNAQGSGEGAKIEEMIKALESALK